MRGSQEHARLHCTAAARLTARIWPSQAWAGFPYHLGSRVNAMIRPQYVCATVPAPKIITELYPS